MEILIIVLLALVLVVAVILLVVLLTRKSPEVKQDSALVEKTVESVMNKQMTSFVKELNENDEKSSKKMGDFQLQTQEFLSKRIDALNNKLDEKIQALDKKVNEKLDQNFKGTSESMAQVRERLKAIDEAQKQMEGLGKEVVSLKSVLEGNQTRGQYGEFQLSMILNSVFNGATGCYEEQYTMKKVKDGDDVRADAVVFMPEPNKMICIDSKFPFQQYKKLFETDSEEEKIELKKLFAADVKKHITAIKDKYIVENKTAPEALMFIPNDGVFAFIHHDLPEVVDYAREKRVIITSPSTLPPMLFTISMIKIDAERAKNAKEISKQLGKLGKDFEMFAKEWDIFSRQIDTATKSRERLDKRVIKITDNFDSISKVEYKDEPLEIEESSESEN